MERYARIIQESQHDLGLEISSFDNIGMSATSFLWEFIRKEDNDSNQEEKFTDTYSENFQDDENKADRFTDDNAYREKFTDDYH